MMAAIFTLILFGDLVGDALSGTNDIELNFREFDRVPTFKDYGLIGVALRAIIWPILTLSGGYAIISPALLYFPLAIGVFSLQIWSIISFRKFAITLEVYIVLAILSVLAPGFVSYNRYCLPVVVVLPIILLIQQRRQGENVRRDGKGLMLDRAAS
jgi:hypothetical protein